jgi:hypothetical protein
VVAFNLGYLPSGDKRVTTNAETTVAALEAALEVRLLNSKKPGQMRDLDRCVGVGPKVEAGESIVPLADPQAQALALSRGSRRGRLSAGSRL